MHLRLRVVEAHQPLAFVDQRRPVALRETLEWQELEHGLSWGGRDLPPTGDEAVDEERRPDLGREDHLLLVFGRKDPRALGRIVAEDRRVEAREETRGRDRVGRWTRRLREVEELASTLVAKAADVRDATERVAQRRHPAAGPVREIADGRWTERAEVASCDEVEGRVRRRRLAQLRGRRDETRQPS